MFFDIGANIGKWSIANLNNTGKIIAIEASPNTFKQLCYNTKNYNQIICLNFAVCDVVNEYINFYESDTNTLSTINKEWLTSKNSRFYNYSKFKEIKCKTIKIDALIEIHGIPELIKIDVEGGEFECLSSLTKKIKDICFEWASETNDITLKCIDYLKNLGYMDFAIQFEDNYTYRPKKYQDLESIKTILNNTTPKKEWGMIWVK